MTPKRFKTGLVVGKFAPLHLGHQLVIDTARAQSERVVVLSYSKPEVVGCEPERRRQWLSALYPDVLCCVLDEDQLSADFAMPHNSAPAEQHRLFVASVCQRSLGLTVDAVFTSEDYGDPFAAALTAYYRRHVDGAHTVVHVSVDPGRATVPTSGSLLREHPCAHRHWLHPLVRASTAARIAFLGAESSGKTTLSRAVAQALQTAHVEEYGRELWIERGGDLNEAALLTIAREQVRREEVALGACRDVLCCDTSPLTTAIYSRLWYGRVADELARCAERTYALTVVCEPDFAFVQDGTRATPEFQREQHTFTLAELQRRGIPHLRVRGPVERRVLDVLDALREQRILTP